MKLSCENELHIFSNTKVSAAKGHGKNYTTSPSPPSLRNRLLAVPLKMLSNQ